MGVFNILKTVFNRPEEKKKKTRKKVKKKTKKKIVKKTLKKTRKKTSRKLQKKPRKKIQRKKSSKPSKKPKKIIKEKEIGVITHYFGKISVGIIRLKAGLKVEDKIHIKGLHDDFTQVVESMQFNHKDIPSATKGIEVGIKVIQRVHENDKVYKMADKI